MAATPRVTLTLTHTRPGQVGSARSRREVALNTYRVDVDGRRAGEVEAYVACVDLTPSARTRRDGVPRQFWFARPDDARSTNREPTRLVAVETVLHHASARPEFGPMPTNLDALARAAVVVRPITEEK